MSFCSGKMVSVRIRMKPTYIRDCSAKWKHFFVRLTVYAVLVLIYLCLLYHMTKDFKPPAVTEDRCNEVLWSTEWDGGFEGFDNKIGSPHYIVPNIVHLIRYDERLRYVSFMDAVNIMSIFKNHNPEKIYIHNNLNGSFTGKHWNKLMENIDLKNKIEFLPIEKPTSIFGKPFSNSFHQWHVGDVLRIEVMKKYGGYFFDNDVYVVRNLDEFRKYEMTVGIMNADSFGVMHLTAHKDARFLKLWHDSYRHYVPNLWYYNAGMYPKTDIIDKKPDVVRAIDGVALYGQDDYAIKRELFTRKSTTWKEYYSIHTVIRHLNNPQIMKNDLNLAYPVVFDEKNILKYNVTILDMVLDCCQELLES